MRLVDDPDTAAWLEQLNGTHEDFDWDAGNRTKNRKHGVEAVDIEGMFQAHTVFVGRIVQPAHDVASARTGPARPPAGFSVHPARRPAAARQLPADASEREEAL